MTSHQGWSAAFTLLLVLGGGCGAPVARTQPSIHMIPTEARLAGGGVDIDFTAPEPGVAFLYDWEETRVALSRSLRKGETLKVRHGRVVNEANSVDSGESTYHDMGLFFVPDRELKLGEDIEKKDNAPAKQ